MHSRGRPIRRPELPASTPAKRTTPRANAIARTLAEPYRTLLGHFRYEIGHHYWERLVRDGLWHVAFREMVGDELRDFGRALEAHYARTGLSLIGGSVM